MKRIPENIDLTRTIRELTQEYRVSGSTISKWRRIHGINIRTETKFQGMRSATMARYQSVPLEIWKSGGSAVAVHLGTSRQAVSYICRKNPGVFPVVPQKKGRKPKP